MELIFKFSVNKQNSKSYKLFQPRYKTPAFYLSVSIKLQTQRHLLHLDVFLVINLGPDVVDILRSLLDEDVEERGGGDANPDADQHDVPDNMEYKARYKDLLESQNTRYIPNKEKKYNC